MASNVNQINSQSPDRNSAQNSASNETTERHKKSSAVARDAFATQAASSVTGRDSRWSVSQFLSRFRKPNSQSERIPVVSAGGVSTIETDVKTLLREKGIGFAEKEFNRVKQEIRSEGSLDELVIRYNTQILKKQYLREAPQAKLSDEETTSTGTTTPSQSDIMNETSAEPWRYSLDGDKSPFDGESGCELKSFSNVYTSSMERLGWDPKVICLVIGEFTTQIVEPASSFIQNSIESNSGFSTIRGAFVLDDGWEMDLTLSKETKVKWADLEKKTPSKTVKITYKGGLEFLSISHELTVVATFNEEGQCIDYKVKLQRTEQLSYSNFPWARRNDLSQQEAK
ncbi:MAG TPA: hypothetical protein VJK48_05905 [Chlamydiales bacterium]|nr:hypothetical protein [Chlamydiales bacterium]